MNYNLSNIKKAKYYLDKSECIGLPTETVYGLAANAYSKKATLKIFKLKKRNKRKVSELNAMIDKRLRNELEKTQETATFKELMNKLENGLLEPELLVEKIINLIKKNN